MTTERRWGTRKTIEVDVVIDNQPSSLLQGRIGNVSVGGLFVKTETARLATNTQVELVLMLQCEDGTRVYRMPAMVVRVAPNGAGLMFDQYDVNAFRALVVLLLSRRGAAASAQVTGVSARFRPNWFQRSSEGGVSAAPVLEGAIGKVARAAAPIASVLPQPSPVHGESH